METFWTRHWQLQCYPHRLHTVTQYAYLQLAKAETCLYSPSMMGLTGVIQAYTSDFGVFSVGTTILPSIFTS